MEKTAIWTTFTMLATRNTNSLFLQSRLPTFPGIVEYQTAQLMIHAKNNLLLINIQKSFSIHEGRYNLRGKIDFNLPLYRTTKKGFCVSVSRVRLWNSFTMELKQCPSMTQFKEIQRPWFKEGADEGGVR